MQSTSDSAVPAPEAPSSPSVWERLADRLNPALDRPKLVSGVEGRLLSNSRGEQYYIVKNPHAGQDYIPHVRRRQGHNLSEGDFIHITSLSLVRANRRGDDIRIVAAKVILR